MDTTEKAKKDAQIHHVLAYSYSVYFVAVIIGVVLNMLLPFPTLLRFNPLIGFLSLLIGTILVVWAQSTSGSTHRPRQSAETLNASQFDKGPYQFSRSPTHLGLFFLILGLGFLMNSPIIIVISIFALALTRVVFIKKEEELLLEKYGEHYREYQHSKKFWL